MNFCISDVCHAFNTLAVGTKVTGNHDEFFAMLKEAVEAHDGSNDQAPGQHFIMLPDRAVELVSCGVGRHTSVGTDYAVRIWRDEPCVFLKREHAARCTGVAVVVYTWDAYTADPDITPEELERLQPVGGFDEEGLTHVVVAVLGFADAPKPEVSSSRFVRNCAGGNNAYLTMSGDELRELAGKVVEYEKTWCTVTD